MGKLFIEGRFLGAGSRIKIMKKLSTILIQQIALLVQSEELELVQSKTFGRRKKTQTHHPNPCVALLENSDEDKGQTQTHRAAAAYRHRVVVSIVAT